MHMILTPHRETGILHGVITYQAIGARVDHALKHGDSAEVKKLRKLGEQVLMDLGAATFLAYDFQAIESARDRLNYMKECMQKTRKSIKKMAA